MNWANNNDGEHEDNTKKPDCEFEEREELSRWFSVSHKHHGLKTSSELTTNASSPAELSTCSSVIRNRTGIQPKKVSGSSGK